MDARKGSISLTNLINEGNKFYEQGKFAEAKAFFEQVPASDRDFKEALNGIGNALLSLVQYEKDGKALKDALEYFDKALTIDPKFPEALNGKANALAYLGQIEKAIIYYDKALTSDSNYKWALTGKGVAYHSLGQYEKALDCQDKALAIDHNFKSALNNKATAHYSLGQYEKALDYFHKALAIDPKYDAALNGKGSTLYLLGELKEAIACFDKVLEKDPDDLIVLCNKGVVLLSQGDAKQAERLFDQALSKKKEFHFALMGKGCVAMVQQNVAMAQRYFERAERAALMFFEKLELYFMQGKLLTTLDFMDKAEAAFKKALQLKPGYIPVLKAMGLQSSSEKLEEIDKLIYKLMHPILFDEKLNISKEDKSIDEEKMGNLIQSNWEKYEEKLLQRDEQLIALEKCFALFQELQDSKDQQIANKLKTLESNFSPIRKQSENEQEKINILKSPSLNAFDKRVEIRLYQFLTASIVLGIDQVSINGELGIKLAEAITPFLAGGTGGTRNISRLKSIIAQVAKLANNLIEKKLPERIARALTLRYEEQISKLTPPKENQNWIDSADTDGGAQTLAECAVARMISFLLDDKVSLSEEKLTENLLLNAVFASTEKQGIFKLTHRKIETSNGDENQTDIGIFRGTGIKVKTDNDIIYYGIRDENKNGKEKSEKYPCSRDNKYGYRWGTQEEVEKLKKAYNYFGEKPKANANHPKANSFFRFPKMLSEASNSPSPSHQNSL